MPHKGKKSSESTENTKNKTLTFHTSLKERKKTYIFKLPERHKLDDVSHGRLPSHRAQSSIVPIQELHGGEVCIPHSYNDDGHRQTRGVDDGIARLIHVCDHSIGDDEENIILLWRERNNTDSR